MSFDLICSSCGAPSGPSVGMCPFCKAVMTSDDHGQPKSPAMKNLLKPYTEGKLEFCLTLVREILKQEDKHADDPALLILSAKILIETEGPNGKTRGLLGKALLVQPENSEIIDYLDMVQARFDICSGNYPYGKQTLEKIIQRSPQNPHALFTLGSSLFWKERNHHGAIPYLEKCLQIRPVYLRAWACLAAIARDLNNPQLAQTALQRCLAIETNGAMRQFFQNLMDQLPLKKAA